MLYFLEVTGNIMRVVPERIYQGSSEGNKIMLVAPFANSVTTEVVFQLPDGQITLPYRLKYIGKMHEHSEKNYSGMHAWQCILPIAVTQNYGEVQVQFYFSSAQNKKIASAVTSFIIERGLLPTLPDAPTEDVYNQLKESVEQLQSDLTNAFYSARAIYAWNAHYTYNANEITFYPCGKFGAFVQSLQAENKNIPMQDGVIDSAWKLLISFDTIADSYFEEIQQIAIQVRNELQQIQDIISDLKEVNNSLLECVEQLPEIGEKNKIYAVLSQKSNKLFTLYIWVNKWLCLGEKGIESLSQLPEGAVLYLPQTLTAEQQQKARENIAAQVAGNYIEEKQLEQHLEGYATTGVVNHKIEREVEQLQDTIQNQLAILQTDIDNQLTSQENDIFVAVDDKLLEVRNDLQEKINQLNTQIEKLENSTSSSGGAGITLTDNVGDIGQPIYLENGEIKACPNIQAHGYSLYFLADSTSDTNNQKRVILIGTQLSTLGINSESIVIGSSLYCTGDYILALGTGIATGDNIISVGMRTEARGSYAMALGPLATAKGEMVMAIGPCAENYEDFSTVIGSDENQYVYYYGSLQSKSDMRDKADIEDLDNKKSLQFINALRTVTYVNNDRKRYRDKNVRAADNSVGAYDKVAHANGEKKGKRRQIGVLAQDIERNMQNVYQKEVANLVNDSLYNTNLDAEDKGLESQKFVNYIGLIPLLISAMQEQQKEIQALKRKLKKLETMI